MTTMSLALSPPGSPEAGSREEKGSDMVIPGIYHFLFAPYVWHFDNNDDFINEELVSSDNKKLSERLNQFTCVCHFRTIVCCICGLFGMIEYFFDGAWLHIWMDIPSDTSREILWNQLWNMNPEGNHEWMEWLGGSIVNLDTNTTFAPKLKFLYRLDGNEEIKITAGGAFGDIELCPDEPYHLANKV